MADAADQPRSSSVPRGRRVLVTGATGFVGRRLCARLRERGDHVTALVRKIPPADDPDLAGLRLVRGDVTTGEGLRQAAADAQCVVHLAAVVKAHSPQGYWRCNAEGTRRLAAVLAGLPTPPRLVLCSSLAAAGPAVPGRPRREDDEPAPVSHYGRSKLAAETAVRELAGRLPALVVRPPIVYGPGDPAFLPSLIPMVRAGVVLKGGLGPKSYSLLHVDDLCGALLAATERGALVRPDDPSAGIYSVCDGVEHTWQSICHALARAMGRRPPVIAPVPAAATWVAAAVGELAGRVVGSVPPLTRDKVREMRCAAWTCTCHRAHAALDFEPSVTFRDGLAGYFATPR